MKSLFIALLFGSTVASGQTVYVSEMGGYSKDLPRSLGSNGFSNELSVGYSTSKYFSFGVLCDFNAWKPSDLSLGLVADAHFSSFYFGASVARSLSSSTFQEVTGMTTTRDKHALLGLLGVHAGLHQHLSKHFLLKSSWRLIKATCWIIVFSRKV